MFKTFWIIRIRIRLEQKGYPIRLPIQKNFIILRIGLHKSGSGTTQPLLCFSDVLNWCHASLDSYAWNCGKGRRKKQITDCTTVCSSLVFFVMVVCRYALPRSVHQQLIWCPSLFDWVLIHCFAAIDLGAAGAKAAMSHSFQFISQSVINLFLCDHSLVNWRYKQSQMENNKNMFANKHKSNEFWIPRNKTTNTQTCFIIIMPTPSKISGRGIRSDT